MRIHPAALPFAVFVTTLAAQSPLQQRAEAAVKRVSAQIPGLSLAVVVDGRIAFANGFGSMAPAGSRPVTADTQYRIASVSKPLTAVAVFKLVEQGRIDLDRPARDYCLPLAALNGLPTVRHFLTHQSGMRHTSDDEDENIHGAPANLAASLAGIVKEKLRFTPGQQTLYTSWGYTVLGCSIETVSGQTYASFLQEHVLKPAGMTGTTFDAPDYRSPQFSQGFRIVRSKFQPSIIVDTRFKMPSSGVISTVNDLARFAIALFDRKLLPDAQFRQMITAPSRPGGEAAAFTAGWTVGRPDPSGARFSYNGSMEGTTAFLAIVPERRTAVALLANRERFVPEVAPMVSEMLQAALEMPRR